MERINCRLAHMNCGSSVFSGTIFPYALQMLHLLFLRWNHIWTISDSNYFHAFAESHIGLLSDSIELSCFWNYVILFINSNIVYLWTNNFVIFFLLSRKEFFRCLQLPCTRFQFKIKRNHSILFSIWSFILFCGLDEF